MSTQPLSGNNPVAVADATYDAIAIYVAAHINKTMEQSGLSGRKVKILGAAGRSDIFPIAGTTSLSSGFYIAVPSANEGELAQHFRSAEKDLSNVGYRCRFEEPSDDATPDVPGHVVKKVGFSAELNTQKLGSLYRAIEDLYIEKLVNRTRQNVSQLRDRLFANQDFKSLSGEARTNAAEAVYNQVAMLLGPVMALEFRPASALLHPHASATGITLNVDRISGEAKQAIRQTLLSAAGTAPTAAPAPAAPASDRSIEGKGLSGGDVGKSGDDITR